MDNSRFWWNMNGRIYDLLMNQAQETLFSEIIDALELEPGIRLDDFGCGTGAILSMIPRGIRARGIDVSVQALMRARDRNPVASLHQMNFYESRPDSYKPDRVVACRSLYHPDIDFSLGIIADHLSENGVAVVAHPVPNWVQYVRPNNKLDVVQVVKSAGRIISKITGYPYTLFSADELEEAGKNHFDGVSIKEAGLGTYYLLTLKK